MSAPHIFDRALIRRRLMRARRTGGSPDFLIARAADELSDRLGAVLREFKVGVDIGSATDHGARVLAASGKVGEVIRLAPLAPEGPTPWPIAVADEEALPLGPDSVDVVVSLLALQGVNDLPGAMAQIRRALRPDGLFLACVLGGETLTELRQAIASAEVEATGGASPRIAPFADARELGVLLQRTGFALPVADVDKLTVRYDNPFALIADLRAMGMANPLVERTRTPLRRDVLARFAHVYAERFADSDGRLRATFDLVWLSGWAPHESQQKPLRPGSAQARLADALGVTEQGTGETGKP